eukprot:TRINITY_DN15424_c0_g1_i1.p1 TRINITY_DN15424_c0_g1~~TRINITY_DN15424_c0_g1_i1.p1  ORF type:complete len:494 (-),score=73.15 TRINITY_DN15424_c0_g1_i1:52-1533(-)
MLTVSLVFLLVLLAGGVHGALSGGYWFYVDSTKELVHSDFAWNPLLRIPAPSSPVVALQPVRAQGLLYYMTPALIGRVSFDGQFNQVLVTAKGRLGDQFAVDPDNNALWYQDAGVTYRCAQNGHACVSLSIPYTRGLAVDPSGSGTAFTGALGDGPVINVLAIATLPSGALNATLLFDIGCCYGPLLDFHLASAPGGPLWSTLSRSPTDIAFYINDRVIHYNAPVPVRPPFFLAPQDTSKVFFSATPASIYVLEDQDHIAEVPGRVAEFVERSACPLDCSLQGNCVEGRCECFGGFYGVNCSVWCEGNVTCSGHGRCREDGGCACEAFWLGPRCSIPALAPPVFPRALSARKATGPAGAFNYFYDFAGQRDKLQLLEGDNVTNFYDLGRSYRVSPEQCVASWLPAPGLDLWRVHPNASLVGVNVSCDGERCSYWKYVSGGGTDEWLVTMGVNLPVEIVIAAQRFVYDLKGFVVGLPEKEVWTLPASCINSNLI